MFGLKFEYAKCKKEPYHCSKLSLIRLFGDIVVTIGRFQAGRLPMWLAHQSPASSTILSTAALRPSGFLPPAVAKWG